MPYETTPKKKRGRKTLIPGEPMRKKVFTIDDMTMRKLRATSDGNMSQTLRKAIDEMYERFQRG